MHTNDFSAPFYGSSSTKIDKEPSLEMDLTMLIVKLYFETKGKIEKKYGDLNNIACGYWPFYIVPINTNNAYVLEGNGLFSEKIKTIVDKNNLPMVSQFIEETSVKDFIRSMEKFVNKIEAYDKFSREEKKIDGLIPIDEFTSYFMHLFKGTKKPYLDSSYNVEPTLSKNAVEYAHEEILKIFNDEPIEFLKKQGQEFEELVNKWLTKIEKNLETQIQDPIESLKKRGEWLFPILTEQIDGNISALQETLKEIRKNAKQELINETISATDLSINKSYDITHVLEEYKRSLKELDDKINEEKNRIERERTEWDGAIETLRDLIERERLAIKGFEDQEKKRRSKFIEGRTIAFKTDKVVTCGFPSYLLNFSKKGKMQTLVRAPLILEEVSLFHKNPYKEPKGYNEFEKSITNWYTKSQNEYEVQKNIKAQDIFSLPNLKIGVSNGIDKLLDLGYLNKKKHGKIRDDELHSLFSKD